MGGRLPYSCFFVECYFEESLKTAASILVRLPPSFVFFKRCVILLESRWCNNAIVLTQLGRIPVLFSFNFCFYFCIIDNQSTECKWCDHTVVMKELGRIALLFSFNSVFISI